MNDQNIKVDERMISLPDNESTSCTGPINNNSDQIKLVEDSKTCQHNTYKIKNTSSDDADGMGTCYTFNVVCSDCKKILAQRYECISATWADILDDEWATRLNLHKWLEA